MEKIFRNLFCWSGINERIGKEQVFLRKYTVYGILDKETNSVSNFLAIDITWLYIVELNYDNASRQI